jgi:hypothetical protein
MGETTPYRVAMSRHASRAVCSILSISNNDSTCNNTRNNSVCSILSNQSHNDNTCNNDNNTYVNNNNLYPKLPKQLNFTKELLINLSFNSLIKERNQIAKKCRNSSIDTINFEKLHNANVYVCEEKKFNKNKKKCFKYYNESYMLFEKALIYTIQNSNNVIYDDDDDGDGEHNYNNNNNNSNKNNIIDYNIIAKDDSVAKRIFFKDLLTKCLFHAIKFVPDIDVNSVSNQILKLLENLSLELDMTKKENIIYIKHKKGILFGYLLSFSLRSIDYHNAIHYGQLSINEMGQLLNIIAHDNSAFPGYVMEYANSATNIAEAFYKVNDYNEVSIISNEIFFNLYLIIFLYFYVIFQAITWFNVALTNIHALYQNYGGDERIISSKISNLYLNIAFINEKNDNIEESERYLLLFNNQNNHNSNDNNDIKLKVELIKNNIKKKKQ